MTLSNSAQAILKYILVSLHLLMFSVIAQAEVVQFHAWGGSAQVNGYLQWVSEQLQKEYGITLHHVKLADTSDAVSRVLAEKAAGNHTNGSVDLIWVNGENFAAMKQHQLLLPNWVSSIPNFTLTNAQKNPAMVTDFGIATEGQEAPWGKASLVFYHNSRLLPTPPRNVHQLLRFSRENPGRFTYPAPTDYLGVSFLKYVLVALNKQHRALLYKPVTERAFKTVSAALWRYLDALHPTMWQQGTHMVRQASALQRLMDSEVLWLSFSFTAAEIPSAVSRFDLPRSTRTYAMDEGSLANVHFLGIPYNAAHRTSALTVVNFLLSPKAQAKKQQLAVWGDATVLDMSLLSERQKEWFNTQQTHPSALSTSTAVPLFAEPHASWTDTLRDAWFKRYGERL
ncbi:ABC transporter substrate-binding protein [Alteromonas sp. 345S023]|uniref:ABC transporter substrate-binding protein n=2 Tax=Alteromonas profundi TaxID=2696062 RepID=A0A7X5RKK5_9ALTE|nr:ABC transporter substrate-binding protein [Alteromonas profundi]NDV90734.1 ABC transporter substrate-binding protein [Alteromonas profundi]